MKSIQQLRGAVVGLGSIGNRHLQNLSRLGLSDLTVVRRSGATNPQFEVPEHISTQTSLDAALSDSIDFVLICNPSHCHVETAIRCLEADVSVLIEKPLAREQSSEISRLVELASTTSAVCSMAYCMRYHPAYQQARRASNDGSIGRCLYAKAWFEGYLPAWHPWEDYRNSYAAKAEQGGGALRTLDHELDYLNWVFGASETAVGCAVNTGGIEIAADDFASVTQCHSSGVVSTTTQALCRRPQSRGFEWVGTDGVLRYENETATLTLQSVDSEFAEDCQSFAAYDINQMYVDLLHDFLNVVAGQRASGSFANLQSGIDTLKVIQAVDGAAT